MTSTRLKRRTWPVAVTSVVIVAATLVAGVWIAGGVISDDFRVSMALTGAWLFMSGVACALLAWRVRAVRIAVIASYIVTVGIVGTYLGVTTLRDRVVDERVVMAAVAAPAPGDGSNLSDGTKPELTREPVAVARGRFVSHEHATVGTATVVKLPDGRRFLTLTRFDTSPGPDLRVRLTPDHSLDGGTDGAVDLGALKGNRGDQQYAIPGGVSVRGRTVLIWCRAFSAPFGGAQL